MHIDVDLQVWKCAIYSLRSSLVKPFSQHKYRTFTVDEAKFPNVQEMFTNLRTKGIKCCTNITPIISLDGYGGDDPYPTIEQAWDPNDHLNPAKKYDLSSSRSSLARC